MIDSETTPCRFLVRQAGNGAFEVHITERNTWFPCKTKEDAEAIAAAPVLRHESLKELRTGLAFADELERTSIALEKYQMSGWTFFKGRAEEVRAAASKSSW